MNSRSAALIVLSVLALAAQTPAHHAGELAISPAPFRTYHGVVHRAELGRLWVRENRAAASGRLIELGFVRLRSTAAKPRSPVVFLSGGPGVPATVIGRVPVYYRLFARLRTISDVILLDQRGVGTSSPRTTCPERPSPPAGVFEKESNFRDALIALAKACAGKWRGEGVTLEALTTAAAADDLDDLRKALGAQKISLLAHSYGTAVALAAIRRHGPSLDRVVLAGVVGPDESLQMPLVFDFGLRRLSGLAAATPGFPDTYAEFQRATEKLGRDPLSVPIQNPLTKERMTLRAGPFLLQFAVKDMLSNGRKANRVPALVYSVARGDATLLIPEAQELYNALASGFNAMQFAVSCSDGWSAVRRQQAEAQASQSAFGDVPFVHLDPQLCEAVGGASVDPNSLLPIWSTVPTLLLSGTLDSSTPAFQADQLLWGLLNGVSIHVRNGFHETLPAPQVQLLVASFFAGLDVRGRVVELPPPTFLTIKNAEALPPVER